MGEGVGVGVVAHAMCMGVVHHRHRGHVVGVVGHWFQVMPWVWVCAVGFVGHAVVGHHVCGFVGHAMGFVWWIINVVVIPWV